VISLSSLVTEEADMDSQACRHAVMCWHTRRKRAAMTSRFEYPITAWCWFRNRSAPRQAELDHRARYYLRYRWADRAWQCCHCDSRERLLSRHHDADSGRWPRSSMHSE
jgi:hypothetical protein